MVQVLMGSTALDTFHCGSHYFYDGAKLLIEHGANVDKCTRFMHNSLHCTIVENNVTIMKLLFENGATPTEDLVSETLKRERNDNMEETRDMLIILLKNGAFINDDAIWAALVYGDDAQLSLLACFTDLKSRIESFEPSNDAYRLCTPWLEKCGHWNHAEHVAYINTCKYYLG